MRASEGRCANSKDHSRMKHTTPAGIMKESSCKTYDDLFRVQEERQVVIGFVTGWFHFWCLLVFGFGGH